jgi:hypothetical protein
MTRRAKASWIAASSGVIERTVRSCAFFALGGGGDPNAPNSTFPKDRFIARLMMMERMNPEAPSSAPAMMRTLLPMANPVADEARPA